MSDRTEDFEAVSNDEWFDTHVYPKIDRITQREDGMYFLAISQCWERHKYNDEYAGPVKLAAFPKKVKTPQKWQPNFSHAVRFWQTLKNKLDSIGATNARVDIRLYLSGASGPKTALLYAIEDNIPRQGLPFFETPFNWAIIPMIWNSETRKYEEEPTIYSYPAK